MSNNGTSLASTSASKYISSADIKSLYSVSYTTLRKWAEDGKVEHVRLPGGSRLYEAAGVDRLMGLRKNEDTVRKRFLYTRVSSAKQKPDLERQNQDLKLKYPKDELVSDVGSGINWSRPGFQRLLDLAVRGKVSEIVVSHKDRLCRFAYDLVEGLVQKFGVRIVVLDKGVQGGDPTEGREQELAEDLLAIVNHFVGRNNGLRSAQHRRKRKEAQVTTAKGKGRAAEEEDVSDYETVIEEGYTGRGGQVHENQSPTHPRAEGHVQQVVGGSQVDL